MVVTELACLRLKSQSPLTDPTNAALNTSLRAGIEAQAKYTKAQASILSQIEDQSYIYIIGKWDSVAQHVDEWIPSPANQEIMGRLSVGLELVWIQYLDLDPDTATSRQEEVIPYSAAVVGIGRYFVSPGAKDRFDKAFSETKHHLTNFKGPREMAGGWRVDREVDEEGNENDEFVLFSGWQSVGEGLSFAENDGFNEFIREREIKHAKWEFTA